MGSTASCGPSSSEARSGDGNDQFEGGASISALKWLLRATIGRIAKLQPDEVSIGLCRRS